MSVRCPTCLSEIPPEYPPEQYPFCMFCSAQLGVVRPPPVLETDREPYLDRREPYPDRREPYPDRREPYPDRREPYPDRPEAGVTARLILESGVGKLEYDLEAPVTTIGRSRSNDISLEDARVSRHHARILRDERGYHIEDLNSRNGTRLDERAVRDILPLADGAVLRIGDSVFRFKMTRTPARGRLAPDEREHVSPPASAPVLFLAPWSPVQCPSCQGMRTMRPVVYGDAARTPGAQAAAHRGEIALADGPPHPNAPNAECRACGTRVRIVQTGG